MRSFESPRAGEPENPQVVTTEERDPTTAPSGFWGYLTRFGSRATEQTVNMFRWVGQAGVVAASAAAAYRIHWPGTERPIEEEGLYIFPYKIYNFIDQSFSYNGEQVGESRRWHTEHTKGYDFNGPDLSRVGPEAYAGITAAMGVGGAGLYYLADNQKAKIQGARREEIKKEILEKLLEGHDNKETPGYVIHFYDKAGRLLGVASQACAVIGATYLAAVYGTPVNRTLDGAYLPPPRTGVEFNSTAKHDVYLSIGNFLLPVNVETTTQVYISGGAGQVRHFMSENASVIGGTLIAASFPVGVFAEYLQDQAFAGQEHNAKLAGILLAADRDAGVRADAVVAAASVDRSPVSGGGYVVIEMDGLSSENGKTGSPDGRDSCAVASRATTISPLRAEAASASPSGAVIVVIDMDAAHEVSTAQQGVQHDDGAGLGSP